MFNEKHYGLHALTEETRRALASLQGLSNEGETLLGELEGIVAGLATDEQRKSIRSFEELAGPLDRLSNMLSEVGPLARIAGSEGQAVIRDLGTKLRVLYKRVLGVVLKLVMNHGDGHGEWGQLTSVGSYLADACVARGELDVFTTNYDALLDAVLVGLERERRGSTRQFALMDEFDGRQRYEIPVFDPDGKIHGVQALRWRVGPYLPSPPLMRIHHLHGAGTWMRYEGDVYKAANLQDLRDVHLFESWAAGVEGQEEAGFVEPVVLLGDQKEASVGHRPFDETYQELIRALTEAAQITIAGYGFQDLPLNRILRDYRGDAEVAVITRDLRETTLKGAFGISPWERTLPDWLRIDRRGLPEALVLEEVPPPFEG